MCAVPSPEAGDGRPGHRAIEASIAAFARQREWLALLAGLLFVGWLLPPVVHWARSYEWVEALQFSAFAIVVPGLFVAGAPWRRLGLAGWAARLSAGRQRHREVGRVIALSAPAPLAWIAWRLPASVNAVVRSPWLVVLEAVSLLVVGAALWLECVESPPLVPRAVRPVRLATAGLVMWVDWSLAYMVGFSKANWYVAYRHVPGQGVSVIADQQLLALSMWLVAGIVIIPFVLAGLVRWLRGEEDPDEELRRMLRRQRYRPD